MNRRFLPLFCLSLAGCWVLACGSSGGRQLNSISVQQTQIAGAVQLTATGTFSSSPVTVSPLPVFWSLAPPPGQYTLSTQPFELECTFTGQYPSPIIAWAPENPNAASSGSISGTQMINTSTSVSCP